MPLPLEAERSRNFSGGPCVSAFKGGALEKIFMSPSKGETLVKISVGLGSHSAVDWRASLPPPRGVSPPRNVEYIFCLNGISVVK